MPPAGRTFSTRMVRLAVAVGAAGQAGPAHSAPLTQKKIQNLDRFIVVTFCGWSVATIAWGRGSGQSRQSPPPACHAKGPKPVERLFAACCFGASHVRALASDA